MSKYEKQITHLRVTGGGLHPVSKQPIVTFDFGGEVCWAEKSEVGPGWRADVHRVLTEEESLQLNRNLTKGWESYGGSF